ncbi:MAG TPA: hypothetical protein VNS58_06185 [Puia sp.]|nr:hypothetical protein [Puia sp.]
MKTSTSNQLSNEAVSLHRLVSRLQSGLMPRAVAKKSFIVNNVDKKHVALTDENTLAFIIDGLIGNAIYSSCNACIWIETVFKGNQIQLLVKNAEKFTYSAEMNSLTGMLRVADDAGVNIALHMEPTGAFTVIISMACAA